jgi:threonine/homoserine/homoserine lactone efflux protein
LTAIAILALFAWFGVSHETNSLLSSAILTIGLIAGLLLWWTTLIQITGHLKRKFEIESLKIINQSFGIILFILAILVLVRVI